MRRGFCIICCATMLIVVASLRAQQSQPGDSQVPVQGARPNAVLKPVSVEGGNWRHALASPTAPQIPWKSAPGFLKPPVGLEFGETMGIASNSRGQVYVFTRRGDGSHLLQFDQNGNFMREIGKNSYGFTMAHGVYVDAQDFVWTIDEGTNTVIKWNPNTARPEMILGRRYESLEGLGPAIAPMPPPHPYAFNRPSDVVTDAQGNIFVADGYNNSRAIKYDKNGRFVASTIGTRGREPGQMHLPHSITADRAGNIYVGDRNNGRVQVFTNDLTLRTMYENVGAPWAVCVSQGPHQYLYVSNSNPDQNVAAVNAVTGEIFKMELDGTVVGKFGKAGKGLGELSTVHDIDCRNENEILVGEIVAWRAQKFTLGTAGAPRTANTR
jgi:DNA-binding beta-propeller fold protein YncE